MFTCPDKLSTLSLQNEFLEGIYSSNNVYFNCFPLERKFILNCIREVFNKPNGYSIECYTKWNYSELVGACLVLPSNQLDRLQLTINHLLLIECMNQKINTIDVIRQLRIFGKKIEKASTNGFYLYSFFITKRYRGKKYGAGFLRNCLILISHKKSPTDKIQLHVNKENLPALKIYENLGFEQTQNDEFSFPVFERVIKV